MPPIIASAANPKIKDVLQLIDKAATRRRRGLIVVEGEREVTYAIEAGCSLEYILWCPKWSGGRKPAPDLLPYVFEVSPTVFSKIAYREHPDGFVAVLRPSLFNLSDIRVTASSLLIVLENVEKPGNLGAVMRTADAVGATGVIVCDNQTDIYNPNAIRASIGTIFRLPVVSVTAGEAVAWLLNNRIQTVATTPMASQTYDQVDYRRASAMVLGGEARGLTVEWLQAADQQVRLPMLGVADSLNVSVTAAVLLYEAWRQRRHTSPTTSRS